MTWCKGRIVVALAAAAVLVTTQAATAAIDTKNVLYIGNSYTYNAVGYDSAGEGVFGPNAIYTQDGTSSDRYFNDPYMSAFEALVLGAEVNLGQSQNIAVGGRTLAQHAGASSTRPTILWRDNYAILDPSRNGGIVWDTIVIQEYSTTPGRTIQGVGSEYVFSQSSFNSFYLNGLSPIADAIKQYAITANPGTDIILFNTWGRAPGAFAPGANNEATQAGYTSYEQMRDRTDEGYLNALHYLTTTGTSAIFNPGTGTFLAGKGIDPANVSLSLVGQAFDFVINDLNRPAELGDPFALLYEPDFSHQAPAGEFLTAAVLFETIYGQSVLSFLDDVPLTGLNGGNADFHLTNRYSIPYATAQYLASVSQNITGVPEPTSLALLVLSGGLIVARRRSTAQ